jgi:hypothetical protein
LPGATVELRWLYPNREHPFHARSFLARRDGLLERTEDRGEVGPAALIEEEGQFRSRSFSRPLQLPSKAPDSPVTTIAIECESEPTQDTDFVRREKPRLQA